MLSGGLLVPDLSWPDAFIRLALVPPSNTISVLLTWLQERTMENSSLRIIHADFNSGSVQQDIFRRGKKTYKACRKCRELKLRCDRRNDDGLGTRCKRCSANSLECIFDLASPNSKRYGRTAYDSQPKRRRYSGYHAGCGDGRS